MAKLVLLRHGESMWNKRNLFTGWVDIPLSEKGIEEALHAGKELANIPFDVIFCSTLVRGLMTAMLVMSVHHSGKTPVVRHSTGKLSEWGHIYSAETERDVIPVFSAWQLNERMYGNLQGLNKKETMQKYGEEQVKIWRRSYAVCPPEGESLEMTTERTIPYFKKHIMPYLEEGKNVLVSAHGNSLRACVKYIENLNADEVVRLEIATGVPLVYEWSSGVFKK